MTRVRLPNENLNKYGARGVREDGHYFDSRAEHRRYLQLKLLEQGGAISNLEVHPTFDIIYPMPDGTAKKISTYEGDFRYRDNEANCTVLEDVKRDATRTRLYRLKRQLVEAQYGIQIREVDA